MKRYWHWGTKIALVYGLFVTGTMTMVAIAVGQRTDLVTPDYYARSLRQDEQMLAERNTAALGASFTATQLAADQLRIEWPHRPESGTVTLYRASNAGADRTFPIAAIASGPGAVQDISLAALERGAWKAQITWTAQGRAYYAEREVTLQ